jgi:hypothetical protein
VPIRPIAATDGVTAGDAGASDGGAADTAKQTEATQATPVHLIHVPMCRIVRNVKK